MTCMLLWLPKLCLLLSPGCARILFLSFPEVPASASLDHSKETLKHSKGFSFANANNRSRPHYISVCNLFSSHLSCLVFIFLILFFFPLIWRSISWNLHVTTFTHLVYYLENCFLFKSADFLYSFAKLVALLNQGLVSHGRLPVT